MKKIYIAPQTEAIKLFGANAIMVGSGLKPIHGIGTGIPPGGIM